MSATATHYQGSAACAAKIMCEGISQQHCNSLAPVLSTRENNSPPKKVWDSSSDPHTSLKEVTQACLTGLSQTNFYSIPSYPTELLMIEVLMIQEIYLYMRWLSIEEKYGNVETFSFFPAGFKPLTPEKTLK